MSLSICSGVTVPNCGRGRGANGGICCSILPMESPAIAEAMSVVGRGCELFALMCAHDLEGIVAKGLADPYGPHKRRLKIKNPDYSQAEGRGDLFNRSA
jgi:hypothetical protein